MYGTFTLHCALHMLSYYCILSAILMSYNVDSTIVTKKLVF